MTDNIYIDIAQKRLKRKTKIPALIHCYFRDGRTLFIREKINKETFKEIYKIWDEEKDWINKLKEKITQVYVKVITDEYADRIFIHLYLDDIDLKELLKVDGRKLKKKIIEMFYLMESINKSYFFDVNIYLKNKKLLSISYDYKVDINEDMYLIDIIDKNKIWYRLETYGIDIVHFLNDFLNYKEIEDIKLKRVTIKSRPLYFE